MRALFLLAVFLIVGCSHIFAPRYQIPVIVKNEWTGGENKEFIVKVAGEKVDPGQIKGIADALKALPNKMISTIAIIHIRDDKEHFSYNKWGKKEYAVAHASGDGDMRICVRPFHLNSGTLWHEAMHSFEYKAGNENNWLTKWDAVAGDVYHNEYSADKGASEGLISEYSRLSPDQDRAEFFEECMKYLYFKSNKWLFKNNRHIKSDKRYLQKLDILKENGFFTEEQYKELKPLFD